MTCIVGLVHEGKTYMGADSAFTFDDGTVFLGGDKVWKSGPYLMGVTGHKRMADLVRYAFALPPISEASLLEGYESRTAFMVQQFVPELRNCLKVGGYAKKEDEQEFNDSQLLVGWGGALFLIMGGYCVIESDLPFMCVGSGKAQAQGALLEAHYHAYIADAKAAIESALRVAERFNDSVRGPFTIIESD